MKEIPITELRIIQRDLLYVSNLPYDFLNQTEILKSSDFFGQFGKIKKVVTNVTKEFLNAYITFESKESCRKAIEEADESYILSLKDNEIHKKIRCTYGTTKYCTFYLKNLKCQNIDCMYLHYEGEEYDVLTLNILKFYNTEFNKNNKITKSQNLRKNIVFHTFLGKNRNQFFFNKKTEDQIYYKKNLIIDELIVKDDYKKNVFSLYLFKPK